MNYRTQKNAYQRERNYESQLIDRMGDGVERTSKEVQSLLDIPPGYPPSTMLGRLKVSLVERRSPWKLLKRSANNKIFWKLVQR